MLLPLMANRIEQIFADLRARNAKAIMPFITAGHPTLDATLALLPALEAAGASICELGIPFSDPIADGPVISASMTEALKHHVTAEQIFAAVAEVRPTLKMGLVAMVTYSIVYRFGPREFIAAAKAAGIDGFIFPDLPLEEAGDVNALVREAGLVSSLLIAPTTPDDRAAAIAKACTGFVYVLARTGITGERSDTPVDLDARLNRLRAATPLPIAVGFGISKPEHVRAVTKVADAAIVGSALVRHIGNHAADPLPQLAEHVRQFVADLATGLR
jgi:tryptophan synthase alpha chain